MYLISGLGNPGEKYEGTPHNAGFYFLDEFKSILESGSDLVISDWEKDKMFESEFCKIQKSDEAVAVFQKPLTFMNESGRAVKRAMRKYKINNYMRELILVHDDLDIALGSYKIQEEKSPRDHKGVISVENSLGGKGFLRIRIGVEARENRNIPGEKFVLMRFDEAKQEILKDSIHSAIRDLRKIIHL